MGVEKTSFSTRDGINSGPDAAFPFNYSNADFSSASENVVSLGFAKLKDHNGSTKEIGSVGVKKMFLKWSTSTSGTIDTEPITNIQPLSYSTPYVAFVFVSQLPVQKYNPFMAEFP